MSWQWSEPNGLLLWLSSSLGAAPLLLARTFCASGELQKVGPSFAMALSFSILRCGLGSIATRQIQSSKQMTSRRHCFHVHDVQSCSTTHSDIFPSCIGKDATFCITCFPHCFGMQHRQATHITGASVKPAKPGSHSTTVPLFADLRQPFATC